MKNLSFLEKKLNINFKNKALLTQSFCHCSYLNEAKEPMEDNERLEFLGDAVLELATTEYLFQRYPEKPEGELTNLRAALVNANTLAEVAKELEFGEYILLSSGEEKENGRSRKYILSDTIEAFIGALYLDQGYETVKYFVITYLINKKLPEIIEKKLYKDPKSLFQEKAQEIVSITPIYNVLKESGPDHMKRFVVGVYLDKDLIGQGAGASKQEAETNAAKNALDIKDWWGLENN